MLAGVNSVPDNQQRYNSHVNLKIKAFQSEGQRAFSEINKDSYSGPTDAGRSPPSGTFRR